jgi:acyl-CoA thioester hydrolase
MTAYDYELQTRFGDEDSYGHVNNAVYLSWAENARAHVFRLPGGDGRSAWELFELDGARPVVGSQRIEYRREVRHDWRHPVVIRTAVARIGSASVAMHLRVLDHTRTIEHAVIETVIVKQSLVTGRSVPLTEGERALLLHWSDEPVTFRS